MTEHLLEVKKLSIDYRVPGKGLFAKSTTYRAVNEISFTIDAGTTLALVGESGCGKSSTSRGITQLQRPSHGQVLFQGQDLCALTGSELRHARRDMQMVFQDPYASLNPRQTIGQIITEPMKRFQLARGTAATQRAHQLLHQVGLEPEHYQRYPHEFSGGQRQRIGIARALAAQPRLLICDEPVSALDVSVQAQVINLLVELKQQLHLGLLFIAHDLAVVRHIADEVCVMHQGQIIERGPSEELFTNPQQHYTKELLAAVPIPDPRQNPFAIGD